MIHTFRPLPRKINDLAKIPFYFYTGGAIYSEQLDQSAVEEGGPPVAVRLRRFAPSSRAPGGAAPRLRLVAGSAGQGEGPPGGSQGLSGPLRPPSGPGGRGDGRCAPSRPTAATGGSPPARVIKKTRAGTARIRWGRGSAPETHSTVAGQVTSALGVAVVLGEASGARLADPPASRLPAQITARGRDSTRALGAALPGAS